MSRPPLIFNFVIAACTFAAMGAPLADPPSQNTRDLVAQLDSKAWSDRELAMLDLINFEQDIHLEDLEYFVRTQSLSPEQHARLHQACLARFATYPKGGLGVSFGDIRVGSIGVIPIANNPRFPAGAMLNPGDAISRVDGQLLSGTFELRAQIVSREPGDLLPVTVLRAGEHIEMLLPLGSFTELTGAARLDPVLAKRALELRWLRKGIISADDQQGEQGVTIDQDQWMAAAFPEGVTPDPRTPNRRYRSAMIAGAHRLVFSGQFRLPRAKLWSTRDLITRQLIQVQISQFEQQLALFEREQTAIEASILDLQAQLADSKLPEEIQRLELLISTKTQLLDSVSEKYAITKAQQTLLTIKLKP